MEPRGGSRARAGQQCCFPVPRAACFLSLRCLKICKERSEPRGTGNSDPGRASGCAGCALRDLEETLPPQPPEPGRTGVRLGARRGRAVWTRALPGGGGVPAWGRPKGRPRQSRTLCAPSYQEQHRNEPGKRWACGPLTSPARCRPRSPPPPGRSPGELKAGPGWACTPSERHGACGPGSPRHSSPYRGRQLLLGWRVGRRPLLTVAQCVQLNTGQNGDC